MSQENILMLVVLCILLIDAALIYFIMLFSRLVEAVDRIANTQGSLKDSAAKGT